MSKAVSMEEWRMTDALNLAATRENVVSRRVKVVVNVILVGG